MGMKIVQTYEVSDILKLHEEIFAEEFPFESFERKKLFHEIYIFRYFEEDDEKLAAPIGYSMVIDQSDSKDLYAWYGGLLPKYQGSGYTGQFFDFLVKKATLMNYRSISLATTNSRPNMLRLAIKYGFDIVDVKKRDDGEGNKVYFRFNVCKPVDTIEIALNRGGKKISIAEIERMLVRAYKSNCKNVHLVDVWDDKDVETIKYVIAYCKKFMRKMTMSFDFPHITN